MLPLVARRALRPHSQAFYAIRRKLSTLDGNPNIYVFPDPKGLGGSSLLTLLPTEPPTPEIAIGTTSQLPPTSTSLVTNPHFSKILQSVIAEHAHGDPWVQAQAAALASTSGAKLGQLRSGQSGGGASDQGGMGGGGRGGWVHVSDSRKPPDYGRIAEPEDIFGSVEVDAQGRFVDGTGRYQESGTYRVVTRDGVLGLSPYLKERLVERLTVEEAGVKSRG